VTGKADFTLSEANVFRMTEEAEIKWDWYYFHIVEIN
jgi:hypothetical protein